MLWQQVTESYQPNCIVGQCDDFAASGSALQISTFVLALGFMMAAATF